MKHRFPEDVALYNGSEIKEHVKDYLRLLSDQYQLEYSPSHAVIVTIALTRRGMTAEMLKTAVREMREGLWYAEQYGRYKTPPQPAHFLEALKRADSHAYNNDLS